MITTTDIGDYEYIFSSSFPQFLDNNFATVFECNLSIYATYFPAGAACAVSWRQNSHVLEHRDQGATRGQQQPSSLQSQPPPSPATPGAKKARAGSLKREKEQEAGELEEKKTRMLREELKEAATDRGTSASLLPPRPELPAPTVT